jgi:hypothetical protein
MEKVCATYWVDASLRFQRNQRLLWFISRGPRYAPGSEVQDLRVKRRRSSGLACGAPGQGKQVCWVTGDLARLAQTMENNFRLRREVYGDAALGARNIRNLAPHPYQSA